MPLARHRGNVPVPNENAVETARPNLRILVINPNSSRAFTDLMDADVAPLRFGNSCRIDCVTLAGAPAGIETQRDIDAVVDPLCALIAAETETTDAFVIGCFADPGLYSAREVTGKPVFGACEAGLATALNRGERFGVISTSAGSRNAELRLIRSYGLLDRCVGLAPVDVPVVEIPIAPDALERMLDAGAKLRKDGADVLVLGCAGMAGYRPALSRALGVPIINPVVSAVAMAIGVVALS